MGITKEVCQIIQKKSNLRARYHLLTQCVSNSVPNASIMMIAQNPTTSSNIQKLRAEIIWGIASKSGYGYINVHDAFLNVVNWETILMNDSVHPNAVGSQVWVGEVMKHFNHTTNLQALAQSDSSFNTPVVNLINNGDFANFITDIPTNWEKLNVSTTVSKDLVNFETGTYGVTVKSAAGNQGGIFQYINTSNPNTPISFFKGKWITLLVRLKNLQGKLRQSVE